MLLRFKPYSVCAGVLCLLLMLLPHLVLAASSGPNSPGSIVNSNIVACTFEWTNPSNAAASDDVRATALPTGGCTEFLQATNFGFSIPSDATINGIEVSVERHRASGDTIDRDVLIVKGGSRGTEDKASGDIWPLSSGNEASMSYGGANDLWGETWTVADINASNFGIAINASETSGFIVATSALIDHITITVHYTEAASAPSGRGGIPRSLLLLRQQNGLDRWGYPISSSSSSTTSSSSSTSTEEPIHEAASVSSADEETTSSASSSPESIAETKDWRWVSDADPAPAAWIVSFRIRVCDRIERWFAEKPASVLTSVLPRLNTRLKNRWEFGCSVPTVSEE